METQSSQTDFNSGNQFNQGGMNQKLPADPTSLILAIIGLVLLVLCCCFFGNYVAIILTIIGLVVANSSIKKYNQSPDMFDSNSLRKVKNAKTFNLIVLIVSSIFTVIQILSLVLEFAFVDREFFEEIMESQGIEYEEGDYMDEEYGDDTYETTEDDWEYEENVESPETTEPNDSLN